MAICIRPMTLDDFEQVLALWQAVEGVGLSSADTPQAVGRYLQRNPGMSFTAWDGPELVGAVLAGHDGRRGFLHHMAVRPSHRKQGVGSALARCCEQALLAEGIDRAHLFVYAENTAGQAFWRQAGWYERPELVLMSRDIAPINGE